MIGLLRRLGEWCSDRSEEYIPDPDVIAILLTFVAVGAALVTGAGPRETMTAWTNAVLSLLPFMAAISVLLLTGDAIVKSPTFTRGLERLARLPNSRFTAAWFTSFVAMAAAIVSWAIGLIVGAIMAKRVAYECREKGITVHYPLLAAVGYTSLRVFHGGLSSSVGPMMADPSLIPSAFPAYTHEGIALSRTIGSTANVVTSGTLVLVIPVLMGLLHPKDDSIRELPPATYEEIDAVVTQAEPTGTQEKGRQASQSRPTGARHGRGPPQRLAAHRPGHRHLSRVLRPQRLGAPARRDRESDAEQHQRAVPVPRIVLWVRPTAIVAQMKDSVSNISGVIFQFPFYAGIVGLLTGTGLAGVIVEFFGGFATPTTWPVIGVLVAGLVNIFIPSGGGQWVAMGPIMLEITTGLGMGPEDAIIIVMLGDKLTNMVQPFWAILLLAIANLRARDIIGYTTVAMLTGFLIVAGWLTLFLGIL